MNPALLTIWLAAHSADLASTDVALRNGRREILLPASTPARYTVSLLTATGGAWGSSYLWTHGHKRWAVALTVADVSIKAWAVRQNLGGR